MHGDGGVAGERRDFNGRVQRLAHKKISHQISQQEQEDND
jgi:hypothetical protein